MKTIIIPTLGAEHLIKEFKLSQGFEILAPLGNKEEKRFFPDGEIYARVPDEIADFDGRVVVLHSGQPDPGNSLTELEIILNALKRLNIKTIEIFFTYFPFCMQDKTEFKGDTNFAEDLIKKFFEYYKVNKIYVLEAHFYGKEWLNKFPNLIHVSALELLKSKAENDFGELVFVAPDIGSQIRANIIGASKTRKNSFEVSFDHDESFKELIDGKVVGVVDDLVETGGTMAKFAQVCRDNGAKEVVALITHGVMESGVKRISEAYSKLYLSNSINREEANVDVSDLIVKAIQN